MRLSVNQILRVAPETKGYLCKFKIFLLMSDLQSGTLKLIDSCAWGFYFINILLFSRRRKHGETAWCSTCFLWHYLILSLHTYFLFMIAVTYWQKLRGLKPRSNLILLPGLLKVLQFPPFDNASFRDAWSSFNLLDSVCHPSINFHKRFFHFTVHKISFL